MKTRRVFLGVLMGLVTLLLVGLASASPEQADGPNLLRNPGFEQPYAKQCCQTDLTRFYPNTPIDEVIVADNWVGWWLHPDQDAAHPSSCVGSADPECITWRRPEWRNANCGSACANVIRSGGDAQKYFTFFAVHDAGMYQQVSGIRSGVRLRFSVYMRAWSTHSTGGPSDNAQTMGMRVGIDPTGGTNPFSPNVVWSAARDTFDTWGLYTVEAVARNSVVTVYTRSTPFYPFQHNDVYVDDASLVVVGGATGIAGRSASQLTRAPTSTLFVARESMPTPAADGKSYYIVRRGDTLTHIAYRFGTSVARIKLLNGWQGNVIIYIGQKIVIGP